MTIYRAIVEEIRLNLQGCDTEENVKNHVTHQQMAFLLTQIYRITKERESIGYRAALWGLLHRWCKKMARVARMIPPALD